LRRLGTALISPLLSLAVVVGLWYLLIEAAHGNALVTKDPAAVFRYLFTDPGAAASRSTMLHQLGRTLRDAGLGYAVGSVIAAAVACAFVLFRPVEQTLMPVVMTLRTAPIVAMAPLLTLLFGHGLLTVAVVSSIVVFFPSLVNMLFGLRSATPDTIDLMRAYGASRLVILWKVRVPSAAPAFFASARIAVPGAFIGALVAEWLATGQGMGYQMLISSTTFDYAGLWTSVVVLTLVSVLVYALVGVVEVIVLARLSPSRGRDV
jgi:ABC-type nitrate/sulfonate/bicarbonate transport system permease component